MLDFLQSYYTLTLVMAGSALLGVVSGALGTFAVLRKQSLLGDVLSHAALPGICLAFMVTQSKDPLILMLGAAGSGALGMTWASSITRRTRLKDDAALGLVLSVFFGAGFMLLTWIQHSRIHGAGQAGLDRFLFGQAAAILERDLVIMASLGAAALLVLLVFWKEFKVLTFDPEFAATLGYPTRLLNLLLTALLVLAIVIGLQTVGVVLMSAMVVAPAAAARQWTDRLGIMVMLAAVFGALAGVGGAFVSSTAARLPTGPIIVLFLSGMVLLSLLFAPSRGLLWQALRRRRNRSRLRIEAVLADLQELAGQHANPEHGHALAVLEAMNPGGGVRRTLTELEERGWARRVGTSAWALTAAGRAEAERRQQGERTPA